MKNNSISKVIFNYLIIYVLFYLIPFTIDYLYVVNTSKLLGDLSYFSASTRLSGVEITFIYFHNIIYAFLGVLVYLLIFSKTYSLNFYVEVNKNKFEWVLWILLSLQILFAVKYKIGSAGGHSSNKFSTIMNLLSIDGFVPLYYIFYRNKLNKRFVITIIIYILLKVL